MILKRHTYKLAPCTHDRLQQATQALQHHCELMITHLVAT